jgi:hypothetical protein
MRLVKLVVAGVAVGAVGGYVGALLRPRTVHRNPAADLGFLEPAPLPDDHEGGLSPEFATVSDRVEAHR